MNGTKNGSNSDNAKTQVESVCGAQKSVFMALLPFEMIYCICMGKSIFGPMAVT